MTPECPKGPEFEAQIEIKCLEENEVFLERAVHLVLGCCDASDVPCEEPDAGVLYEHVRHGTAPQSMRAVAADVERITAEVQAQNRLYRKVGAERDEKQFEIERLRRWVDRFRERAAEHRAEVSRLREQLASQPALPQVDDDRIDRVAQALHEQRALEFAWNVKPWKELRAEDQRRFRRQAMAAVEAVFAGVSSPEVEAPQPQPVVHRVMYEQMNGEWQATCDGCPAQETGSLPQVEYWRDQHEADTLRPQLQANSKLEQNLDDAALFAVAQDRVRRDKGVRHTLEDVAAELELLDEGRPLGSGAAEPRPVLTTSDSAAVNDRVRFSRWDPEWDPAERAPEPIEGVVFATRRAGRDFVDVYADNGQKYYGVSTYKVIGRADAAQAARSEATLRVWAEVDLQPCPEDVRQVLDCNNFAWRRLVNDQWITGHQGDGPCGWPYLIKKFGPLTEVPSPSLRKEGGDSEAR